MKIWGLWILLGGYLFFLSSCHLKSEKELQKEAEEEKQIELYKKEALKRTELFLIQQKKERKQAEIRLKEKQTENQKRYQAVIEASERFKERYLKEEAIRVEQAKKRQLELAKQQTEYDIDLEATSSFPWEENFEIALQKAISSGKPGLMLYFRKEGDANCLQLENQVFRNRFLIDVLQQNFVPLKITLTKDTVLEPFLPFYPPSESPPVLQFISSFLLFDSNTAIIGAKTTPQMVRLMEAQVKQIEELNTQYSYLLQKIQKSENPEFLLPFASLLFTYGRAEEACVYYRKSIDFLKSSYDHEQDSIQALFCFMSCEHATELEILLSIFQENYVDSHQQCEICYKVGQFFQKSLPEKARKWFLLGLKYPDPSGEWYPKIQQALTEMK